MRLRACLEAERGARERLRNRGGKVGEVGRMARSMAVEGCKTQGMRPGCFLYLREVGHCGQRDDKPSAESCVGAPGAAGMGMDCDGWPVAPRSIKHLKIVGEWGRHRGSLCGCGLPAGVPAVSGVWAVQGALCARALGSWGLDWVQPIQEEKLK
jgi:hypothetical protein